MRSSYQELPSIRTLAPILELGDPHASGQHRSSPRRGASESPISSPVLIWSDDGQAHPSSQTKDGPSLSPACPQPLSSGRGFHRGSETSKAALVWRSIGNVVSQMKAMQQQISVSAAILKVMSAISVEASEVQEARRKMKEDLDRAGHNVKAELGASVARVQLDKRLSCLREQVTCLQDLLASERLPNEQEVLEVLSKLKVSRIKTIATAALSFNSLKPTANKDTKSLTFRSALGLPSLKLRKRDVKAIGAPSGDLSMDTPTPVSSAVLEDIEARALQYSSSFSAFALAHASRRASLPRKTGQETPMGIPSLPKQRKTKSSRNARVYEIAARSGAAINSEGTPEDSPMRLSAEVQEQVLARALRYSDSFSAIALRHASRQASFLQQTEPPPAVQATTPIGIPSLPKRRTKMKSRRRAQAQVDEAAWKASCSVLT